MKRRISEAEREALRARVTSFCEAIHGNGNELAAASGLQASVVSAFKTNRRAIGPGTALAIENALDALETKQPRSAPLGEAARADLLKRATRAAQSADPEVSRLRRELAAAEERVANAVRDLIGGAT